MTPTSAPTLDNTRPLPGKRTPSELKWLLNERAALAGEAQRLGVREQRLANRLRRLEPLLARTRQELAQTHQSQSETSERIASLDLTMHLMQPALNPEAGGTVKAWAGRYGERGALTEFIREVLLKVSPNYISLVSLRDLVIAVNHTLVRLCNSGEVERMHDPVATPNAPGVWRWKLEAPTYITEQCYCEHRVHLWLKAPSSMVSIPRKLEGSPGPSMALRQAADTGLAFHARAAELSGSVVQASLRKLLRAELSLVLAESPFLATFADLPIAGIPDAVHFERALARCLLDYKVTDSNQLQMGHRVQLLLYGWLLQESGFKLSDALMVSVLVPNEGAEAFGELDEVERQRLAVTVHQHARAVVDDEPERKNWYVKKLPLGKGFWVRLLIFRYDRRAAKRELDFFAPYWRGERAAIPSSNFRKCRVCLYNGTGDCKVAVGSFEGVL